jgi:putative two-component system response regulator
MKVLIVDDDEYARAILRHSVQEAGYDVDEAEDGEQALERVRSGNYRIVISDWEMPRMNGLELCRHIRRRSCAGYAYIILITARNRTQDTVEGLSAGADGFLTKPFDPHELRARLKGAERLLSLESRNVTIFALAKLAERRDLETGAHLERMREYARSLAQRLAAEPKFHGIIDGDFIQTLYLTAPLHDIGKVGIPDRVLLKPGKLTDEEYAIMKKHAEIGAETLAEAARACSDPGFLKMAYDIAHSHHERYDGMGYPRGMKGEDIPLCARIAALADVYDALTSDRVYRAAMSHAEAKEIILRGNGTHFDPDVVAAFLELEDEFQSIRIRHQDNGSTVYADLVAEPAVTRQDETWKSPSPPTPVASQTS